MGKTRILLALTAISMTLFAGLAAPASAEIRFNKLIQNQHSHRCLEVIGFRTDNFAPVVQFDCHGGANQQWTYNTVTGIVQNVHSGKCLEIVGFQTHNGAHAVQFDCHGGANQRWGINRQNGVLVNQHSQKFLFVIGNATHNFAQVGQSDYMIAGPSVHWWLG